MLDQDTLDSIVGRIVEVAQPERIILFGSAARGEMGRNSDVDLLIVKDGADALDLMAQIYRRLHGVGAAVDAIVVSPATWNVTRTVTRSSSSPRCEKEGWSMKPPERFSPDDPREC